MQTELMLIVAVGLLAMALACQVLSRRLEAVYPEPPNSQPQPEDIEIFYLVRGSERYVLLVAATRGQEATATVQRWVADPELAITWVEGDLLIDQIKTRCQGKQPQKKEPRRVDHDFEDF